MCDPKQATTLEVEPKEITFKAWVGKSWLKPLEYTQLHPTKAAKPDVLMQHTAKLILTCQMTQQCLMHTCPKKALCRDLRTEIHIENYRYSKGLKFEKQFNTAAFCNASDLASEVQVVFCGNALRQCVCKLACFFATKRCNGEHLGTSTDKCWFTIFERIQQYLS